MGRAWWLAGILVALVIGGVLWVLNESTEDEPTIGERSPGPSAAEEVRTNAHDTQPPITTVRVENDEEPSKDPQAKAEDSPKSSATLRVRILTSHGSPASGIHLERHVAYDTDGRPSPSFIEKEEAFFSHFLRTLKDKRSYKGYD